MNHTTHNTMHKYIAGAAILFLTGLLFFAGKPEDKAEAFATPNVLPKTWAPYTITNAEPMAIRSVLPKTWPLDTITDAENDTLTMPWTMESRYTGALQITRTNISGTTNVAVSIQASVTSATSTDVTWVTVATTAATTATAELLTLAETYGQRYRIIVDGTGTQSTSYRLSWLGKRMPSS